MKTRIRVAYTVDADDEEIHRILKQLYSMFSIGKPAADVHLVAVRQGEALFEIGKSPAAKDMP